MFRPQLTSTLRRIPLSLATVMMEGSAAQKSVARSARRRRHFSQAKNLARASQANGLTPGGPSRPVVENNSNSTINTSSLGTGNGQIPLKTPGMQSAMMQSSLAQNDAPRFNSIEKLVDSKLMQTITEDLKFQHMSAVQAATLQPLLAERIDILAQAKTGTGKTLAFLIPAIQTLVEKKARGQLTGISTVIISPTRELAEQIADEAKRLLKRYSNMGVSCIYGGTGKVSQADMMIKGGCKILVATPGRLLDHLENDARIPSCFHSINTLILDEADRLLDMGFIRDLEKIIALLPDKKERNRQGMLFSATMGQHVAKVAHLVLKPNYKTISTIPKGEVPTHEKVQQNVMVVPKFSDQAAALIGSLQKEMKIVDPSKFKAIVFAPAGRLADYYYDMLSKAPGLPNVDVIHSRLSQGKRNRASDSFRAAKNGILVATDVIARGMDFPAVTNVFQVGVPMDKESFIHRLGRTGRAGAEGRGTFILAQDESYFLSKISDMKLQPQEPDLAAQRLLAPAIATMSNEDRTKTYQAWLGYYKSYTKPMGITNGQLVAKANEYAALALGAKEAPKLEAKIIGKMGLRGTPGLMVAKKMPAMPRMPDFAGA